MANGSRANSPVYKNTNFISLKLVKLRGPALIMDLFFVIVGILKEFSTLVLVIDKL